jgi:hypothetical protein
MGVCECKFLDFVLSMSCKPFFRNIRFKSANVENTLQGGVGKLKKRGAVEQKRCAKKGSLFERHTSIHSAHRQMEMDQRLLHHTKFGYIGIASVKGAVAAV